MGLKFKARSRCAQLRHETVRQACVASCVKCFWSFAFVSFAKRTDHSASYADDPPNRQDCILPNRKCKQLPSHVSDATSTIHFSLFEASWVRDQILRRQFLQQQLQCRSRSTRGKETDWRQRSSNARQLKCQSSLIVTDPAFSRAWMDKENADFRRVQQTRQNPTTLALPLVELLFLLVFIPPFLTCS